MKKPHAKTVAWSYDMEGHARQCVEQYCVLANKKVEHLLNVSSPCMDEHQFKKEDLELVGELFNVCSNIVLECLYHARIGRSDILWSVNKRAQTVKNGFRHVADDRHEFVDWVISTQTAGDLESSKTNLKEHYVSSEAEHVFSSVARQRTTGSSHIS